MNMKAPYISKCYEIMEKLRDEVPALHFKGKWGQSLLAITISKHSQSGL